jgi:Na+/proline symporter
MNGRTPTLANRRTCEGNLMLGLSPLDIIIIVIYFLVIAGIGIASSYFIRNREDFLMGGRRFGKALMILFSFGSGTHADNAVGVAAQSYKVGFSGIWYQWVMVFTLPIYWLLAPVYRRARVLTTADFFELRFGREFTLLYSLFALFYGLITTSVMLYATSRLLEALMNHAIAWQWIVLIIATVSFFYGVAGGLIAAVWNDFIQGILTIVMSLLIIPFFWSQVGGLDGFQARLADPQETFRLVLSKDMTFYWIMMMTIAMLASMVTQPHIMSNAASSKTEMDSRVGFVGGLLLKRLITIPWALTGVMALALYGAGKLEPDHIFGTISRDLLPAGFVGLMLSCVMASVMDNCAVMMVCFSGIYTNNIHKRYISRNLSESRLVLIGRLAAVVFAIISLAAAYLFRDVTEAMRLLFQTTPLMGITFYFAILWRRSNRYGVFAAYFAAIAAVLIAQFWLDWHGDTGLPKIITLYLSMGIGAGILVSLLTPPEPKHKLDQFYLLLKTPIGQEDVLRKAGFREIPGTGTFEPSDRPPADFDYAAAVRSLDRRQSRRHAIWGIAILTATVAAMLIAVKLLARWLATG